MGETSIGWWITGEYLWIEVDWWGKLHLNHPRSKNRPKI